MTARGYDSPEVREATRAAWREQRKQRRRAMIADRLAALLTGWRALGLRTPLDPVVETRR